VTTNTFDVSPATASQLVLSSAPAGLLTAGVGFNVQLVAEDPFGNVDPTFSGPISAALVNNPAAGTLGGPLTGVVQAGAASFIGLTLSQGGPYALSFRWGTLTPAILDVTVLAFQHSLPSVAENTTAPVGNKVSALLLSNFSDSDSDSKPGIAVTQTSGNGTWQYSANGKSWSSIGAVSAGQALLLPASYRVRFVPALNWIGQASLIFTGWDGSQGKAGGSASTLPAGGTTAFSLAPAQANLTVTQINYSPAWLPGSAALTPIQPGGNTPTGESVTSIFGAYFSDVYAGNPVGVAVTGLTGTSKGTWEYSLGGTSWTPFGSPSISAARLLSNSDSIRFVPNLTNSPEIVTLQAYAWDGSAHTDGGTANLKGKGKTGGLTAFSSTPLTARFAINDAPSLTSTAPALAATLEDVASASTPIGTLLITESDQDQGALNGVAVVAAGGPGTWQYSLDGKHWQAMGTVSESLALLLPSTADVRFLPALYQSGQATLTYRAWDQSAGTAGTLVPVNGTGGAFAFSSTEASATLNVEPVDHAPSWTGAGPSLAPVHPGAGNPTGESIDSLFSGNFRDVDSGTTTGIAVTGLTGTSEGTWQYSLDGGKTWQSFGTVNSSAARLLSGLDQVRFLPAPSFVGSVTLRAYAWDGSSGTNGSTSALGPTGSRTAFSTTSLTATCLVDTAPMWTGNDATLTPVLTDAGNPAGDSVASVFGAFFSSDVSRATTGIAVTGLTGSTKGTWQYSLDDGKTWTLFSNVSTHAALLLSGSDWIRFLPQTGFSGTVNLQASAWDGTNGSAGGRANLTGHTKTGGNTAFSTTTLTAMCLVNTAPVLEPS
jgi:hypothetical protein